MTARRLRADDLKRNVVNLVNLALATLVVFGASAAIALAAGFGLRRLRRAFVPPPNAKLRLRTGAAVYRCRFIAEGPLGWIVSAPLQRDAYVPIEVGAPLACEATVEEGVALFDSRVRFRRSDPAHGATLVLEAPRNVRRLNRRDDPRLPASDEVTLDGQPARLLDLSQGGARLRGRHAPPKGRRVVVRLADGATRSARVLDVESGVGGHTIRVQFEDAA